MILAVLTTKRAEASDAVDICSSNAASVVVMFCLAWTVSRGYGVFQQMRSRLDQRAGREPVGVSILPRPQGQTHSSDELSLYISCMSVRRMSGAYCGGNQVILQIIEPAFARHRREAECPLVEEAPLAFQLANHSC